MLLNKALICDISMNDKQQAQSVGAAGKPMSESSSACLCFSVGNFLITLL
jgi:hypothetical protein